METITSEWMATENNTTHVPSPDFIRAVAELLETDADDILSELGYTSSSEPLASI